MVEERKVPEIRFAEYLNLELNEYKGMEIFKTISDKNHPNLDVLSATQDRGMVKRDDLEMDIQYNLDNLHNYKKVRKGQFVIHLRSFQGGFAYSNINGITSPAYTVIDFTDKDKQYPLYWKEIFSSNNFIRKLESATYGVRDGRNISFKDFSYFIFTVPGFEEQEKIGSLFAQLDKVIELQENLIEENKTFKKSMLQKMFPKEGEFVPEIRFEGFEEEWEIKKLGSIGRFKSGTGFPNEEQGGKEGVPFYKVSDMNINGNENVMTCANNYVTEGQIEKRKWKPITDLPAVIFAKVGAAIMLNRKRLVLTEFLIDNNMMSFSFDVTLDYKFGKVLFDKIFLPKYAQVGALPSYNSSDLEHIKVLIPSYQEQEKIGSFFQTLDSKIQKEEKKLEIYKTLKQALLQKMFV